jgi:tyrosinase
MFDDILDPNNSAFVPAADAFKAQYKDAIANASYWATTKNPDGTLNPSPQYNQLLNRSRKQLAKGYPILPDGYPAAPGQTPKDPSDYATWAREPFLFFVDVKGNPAQQNTAGAYASIGGFDYDYSPGSGEEVVPVTPQLPAVATVLQRPLPATLAAVQVEGKSAANAAVMVPSALLQQQAEPQQPKLFALVTVEIPPEGHEDLDVFIRRADGTSQFVATLSMFGHHLMHGPVTYQVPLSAALATLQANQKLEPNPTLNLQVVPRARSVAPSLMAAHVGAVPGGTSVVTAVSLQQL